MPEFPPVSEVLKDLIQKMLQYDEKNRLSWDEVFEHAVFKTNVQRNIEKVQGPEDEEDDNIDNDLLKKSMARYKKATTQINYYQTVKIAVEIENQKRNSVKQTTPTI